MPPLGYPMNNAHAHAGAHHTALADLLDPATIARLALLGDWDEASCLELGAGGGSIARWLAEQVGPDGTVMATDLDPSLIPHHPRIRPLQHDLRGGDPIPGGPFDLIHARLVLSHLPQRDQILPMLAGLLTPGGVILIEDWAPLRTREQVIIAAPTDAAAALYAEYQHTIGVHILDQAGTDPTWARRIHPAMLTAGLTGVHTEIHATYWTGGSPGCQAVAAVAAQVRPRLREFLTDSQLDQILGLLTDPRLIIHGHPMYATSGRAPA
jgi:SAM-dependent methyltransferase